MPGHPANVSRTQDINTSYNLQPTSDLEQIRNSQQQFKHQQTNVKKPLARNNTGTGPENLPEHTKGLVKKLKNDEMPNPEVRDQSLASTHIV